MSRDQYLDHYQHRARGRRGVCSPVVTIAIRSAIEVFYDGRDPDGIEAKSLDVGG
jgi:hypothetical protein